MGYKINNLINWLTRKADHYVPDRQMYLRAKGDVRFVSISQKTQIFAGSLLVCFTLWMVVASYNYIYINEILSDKDTEVNKANRDYHALEEHYSQLQSDIQNSTSALKQRQIYIQQVLEDEITIDADNAPIKAGSNGNSNEKDTVDYDIGDKEAKNNIRGTNLDRIYVDLKHVEMQQNIIARSISGKIDNKLNFLKNTLDKAGIIDSKMLELAGDLPSSTAQGGPYIALEAEINNEAVNNVSFDLLYQKRSILKDLEMAIAFLPIATPPEKHYVSSKFGVRRDPITKKWATHKGIDMAGWTKTPINAGGDGIITKAGINGAFGLFIEIDHGNGFRSRYGHLSKLKVKRGDKVEANQLIGLMGSTGRSTSTHLHYEIWFNGEPIDPLKVLKAAKDVQKIKQQRYDS